MVSFVLFLTVLAFTHISRSLYLGLIGCAKTTHRLSVFAASSTYTASLTTTVVFRLLPLPHGQGSLRPTFFPAMVGFGGFNNRFGSLTSSGLSGSNPIRYFQPCASNVDVTSLNRASDCTLTTAGFFSVPNLAVFLAPNILVLFAASTLFLIVPMSEILFPIHGNSSSFLFFLQSIRQSNPIGPHRLQSPLAPLFHPPPGFHPFLLD